MPHDLPSARHLADLHGFYAGATFPKNGTCTITFTLPPDMKRAVLDVTENDGMALNISVWETQLPEGDEMLARALGIEVPGAGGGD